MSEETAIDTEQQTEETNEQSLQFIAAEDLRKKKLLPKFPAWSITIEDLQKWLDLLTTDQLPRVLIYLYRTMPIIVRQQVDPNADTNIDKVSGIDENNLRNWKLKDVRNGWIKNSHGGGGYRLDICDTANPNKKGKGGKLGECRFVIPENEAEPIINLHELNMGAKENKAYINKLVAQGKIDKDYNVIETNRQNGNGDAAIAAMKEAFAMAEKLNASQQAVFKKEMGVSDASSKAMGDILTEIVKQNDPKKQMDQMLTMVTALTTAMKSTTPPVVSQPDNTTAILKLMMDQSQQNMQMFMKMMDMQIAAITNNKATATTNPSDPMDLMDRLMAVTDRMMQWREGKSDTVSTEEEPKDWKDKLLDIGEKIATPLALSWLQKQYAQPTGVGIQSGLANPPAQFSPPHSALPKAQPNQTHVGAGRPYSPYAPGAQIAAPTTQQQIQPEPALNPEVVGQVQQPQQTPPQGVEVLQAIAAYGPMITEKMIAGVKGYDFGEWVKNGFGITPIMLVKKYPAEQILAMIKQQIPQFWEAVQHLGDEYVINWIDEFGRTEEILDKLDQEDDGESSPL